jgi:hypothetical protein
MIAQVNQSTLGLGVASTKQTKTKTKQPKGPTKAEIAKAAKIVKLAEARERASLKRCWDGPGKGFMVRDESGAWPDGK